MTREALALATWFDTHEELRGFLQPLVSIGMGRRMASDACGLWVRNAGDGKVPTTCAYALAFDAVSHVLISEPGPTELVSAAALSLLYPLPHSELPWTLAKLYWDIWKAGQLLSWDKKTVNRASKGISDHWPWGPSQYAALDPNVSSHLAKPLGRRAVEVLDEHECLDCAICTEWAEKWEAEHARTEAWITARRQQRKE